MKTIKLCTDYQQSKVLSKILSIKSADMYYSHEFVNSAGDYYKINIASEGYFDDVELLGSAVPAWSLASLLDVLPNKLQIALAINDFQGDRKEKYVIGSVEHDEYDYYADNPVDACYEMIIKLNELNLL